VNVEHSDCLSWFLRKRESHQQDGETLTAQLCCNAVSATGDPAMAFGPSSDRNGQWPVHESAAMPPGNSGRFMRAADKRAGLSRAQTF
jgi:hypothetical protein